MAAYPDPGPPPGQTEEDEYADGSPSRTVCLVPSLGCPTSVGSSLSDIRRISLEGKGPPAAELRPTQAHTRIRFDGRSKVGRLKVRRAGFCLRGAVGVGGCARLPSSAAGMRSVSSSLLRCAWTLWAVSGNPSGIPGNTMRLATGTSARLRAGHDVCRAPGSAARWGRAGGHSGHAHPPACVLRGR